MCLGKLVSSVILFLFLYIFHVVQFSRSCEYQASSYGRKYLYTCMLFSLCYGRTLSVDTRRTQIIDVLLELHAIVFFIQSSESILGGFGGVMRVGPRKHDQEGNGSNFR